MIWPLTLEIPFLSYRWFSTPFRSAYQSQQHLGLYFSSLSNSYPFLCVHSPTTSPTPFHSTLCVLTRLYFRQANHVSGKMCAQHSFIKLITVSLKPKVQSEIAKIRYTIFTGAFPPLNLVGVTATVTVTVWHATLCNLPVRCWPFDSATGFVWFSISAAAKATRFVFYILIIFRLFMLHKHGRGEREGVNHPRYMEIGNGNNISIQIRSRIRSQSVFKVPRILHFVKIQIV